MVTQFALLPLAHWPHGDALSIIDGSGKEADKGASESTSNGH